LEELVDMLKGISPAEDNESGGTRTDEIEFFSTKKGDNLLVKARERIGTRNALGALGS